MLAYEPEDLMSTSAPVKPTAQKVARILHEREAAAYIGMSVAFLRAGRLGRGTPGPPFVRIGRSVRYALADLDAWLATKRVSSPALR